MDYAERGAVEKTFDELLMDFSDDLKKPHGDSSVELITDSGKLSSLGQSYTAGILTGILATIRVFSDEPTELTNQDVEELDRIVARREREMAQRLVAETETEAQS